jgi:(p)ppGpp synthase/HD superfamily hydrolase
MNDKKTVAHTADASTSPSKWIFYKWASDIRDEGSYRLQVEADEIEEFFADVDRVINEAKAQGAPNAN